jgi:KaiC/GvpD/RAD55 family RecA-like ATPase
MNERREEQAELEAALPSLIPKLADLRRQLGEHERIVFDEIVRSAARHTDQVNVDDVSAVHDRVYDKPMSVHITQAMRQEMLHMPERLGIEDG